MWKSETQTKQEIKFSKKVKTTKRLWGKEKLENIRKKFKNYKKNWKKYFKKKFKNSRSK